MHVLKRIVTSVSARIIGRRVLQAIPVIIGVSFFTFTMLNTLPGGIAKSIYGINQTPLLDHILDVKLGLNHPFMIRYLKWLGNAVIGHFGTSLVSTEPVSSILAQRLPVTVELFVLGLIFSLLFAVPVAMLAAKKPRGVVDRISIAVSMFGFSCPQFVYGLLLILIFAVHFRLLPAEGFVAISQNFWGNIDHMVLPSIALSFGLFCGYTRLLRADLVDQMHGEDYVTTARAKGQSEWKILTKHALKNSMFGLITVIALNLGTLVGGTVLIEQIFALPGMGQELLQAIIARDYTVVNAIVVLLAAAIVLGGLFADLVYAALDPRIRYGRSAT